jgi:tetratricopeptide (TPR) repeat protein
VWGYLRSMLQPIMSLSLYFALFLAVSLCRAGATGNDSGFVSADTLNRHGADLERQGRSAEAEAAFRLSLDACRQTSCPFLAAILNNLGSLFYGMARYREAEPVLQQAIEASAADGQDPDSLPAALVNLGAVYRAEARYADAGRLYERALKLRQDDPASAAQEVPRLWTHMAALAQDMGNPQRAEELIRKALASYSADGSLESADGLAALVHLGSILASEGKFAEAEAVCRRALAVYRVQPPGAGYAAALNDLGSLMAARGRPKEAEKLLREAVAVWERLVGPDHPSVAPALMNLGAMLQARHRYDEAEACMDRAARIDAHNLPANHPRIAIDLKNQAGLLVARKRYREAEQVLLHSIAILEQQPPAADPELGQVLANLGEAYRLEKRLAESRANFGRGMKILNTAWGPLDPRLLTWLDDYASVLRAAEEYTEAERLALQATHIRVLQARRRAS